MEIGTNYQDILVDETALEGLDGITLPSLWLRLEDREDFLIALDEKSKAFLWRALVTQEGFQFFELPAPRPDIKKLSHLKQSKISPADGIGVDAEIQCDDLYPVEIISKDGVLGSCSTYGSQISVTDLVRGEDGACLCTLTDAMERWGQRLVVVASQSQRNKSLMGAHVNAFWEMTPLTYCMLERIGRSRYDGVTTSGPPHSSFMCFPKEKTDPKIIFYSIKILKKRNLVRKQIVCVNFTSTNLVHLPRFYSIYKFGSLDLCSRICTYLSQQPQQRAQLTVVKDQFQLQTLSEHVYKRFIAMLKRWVEVQYVPYREYYPDASPAQYLTKSKAGEKTLSSLKLVKKFSADAGDEDEKDGSDDDEGSNTENKGRIGDTDAYTWRYGESYMRQVFQQIHSAGKEGLTQNDLDAKLGIGRLNARSILRFLTQAKLVQSVVKAMGRKRETLFFAQEFMDECHYHVEREKVLAQFHETSTGLQIETSDQRVEPHAEDELPSEGEVANKVDSCADYTSSTSTTPEKSGTKSLRSLSSIHDHIKVTFLEDDQKGSSTFKKYEMTARMIRRGKIILDLIQKHRVIESVMFIKQAIDNTLKEDDDNQLCHKVVRRLIDWCYHEGKLQKFRVRLEDGKKVHNCVLACANGITKDDPLVEQALIQVIIRYFQGTNFGFPQAQVDNLPKSVYESFSEWNTLWRKTSKIKAKLCKGHPYGILPKMQRARLLHKFLWYLIYGYQGITPDTSSTVTDERQYGLGQEQQVGPISTDTAEEKQDTMIKQEEKEDISRTSADIENWITHETKEPSVYLDTRDWRRYLAPLKKHDDVKLMIGRNDGIFLTGDIFQIIPISIFVQIINITSQIDGFEKILIDSKLRHYPLLSLPASVIGQLFANRRFLMSFMAACDVLCMMGLISYGPEHYNDKSKQFVYVHKCGTILDTQPSTAGYMYTHLPEGLSSFQEVSFTFDTMDCVESYWSTLQTVALGTDLNNHTVEEKMPAKPEMAASSSTICHYLDHVQEEHWLPGDQRGAAGMDSSMYIHLSRNWFASTVSGLKDKNDLRISVQNLSDMSPSPVLPLAGATKRQKQKQKLSEHQEPRNPSTSEDRKLKKMEKKKDSKEIEESAIVAKGYQGNRGGRGIRRVPRETKVKVLKTKKKLRWQKLSDTRKPKGRKSLDEKDQEALRNMSSERVKWTAMETSVLLMCRVASIILMPDRHKPLLNFHIIRNILQERLPRLTKDKTHMACQRRLIKALRSKSTCESVSLCVLRVKQDKELLSRYENSILQKGMKPTEQFYKIYSTFVNELLNKFTLTENRADLTKLPLTMRELQQDYEIVMAKELDLDARWQDPASDMDACRNAVRDLQMSHVLSAGDKQSRLYELYNTLLQYPDPLLSSVFNQLITDRMITRAKRRESDHAMQKASSLARQFLITQVYKLKFQVSHTPVEVFFNGFKLLKNLVSMQGQAKVGQGQEGLAQKGKGQKRRWSSSSGVQDDDAVAYSKDDRSQTVVQENYFLLKSDSEAGHVGLIIGLTAMKKIRLKIDIPTEIFNLSETKLKKDIEPRQGIKCTRTESESDEDIEDEIANAEEVDDLTMSGSVGQSPKRLQIDIVQTGRKRKSPLSGESSIEEECTSSKKTKLSGGNDSSISIPSSLKRHENLALTPYLADLVTEGPDGFKTVKLNSVSFRYETVLLGLPDPRLPSEGQRKQQASFALVSLTRMRRESEMDVRNASKVDRFLIISCKIGVALKDVECSAAKKFNNITSNAQLTELSASSDLSSQNQKSEDISVTEQQCTVAMETPVNADFPAKALESCLQDVGECNRYDHTVASQSQAGHSSSGHKTVSVVSANSRPVYACAWKSEVLVDHTVMEKILHRIQKLLPFHLDMEVVWSELGQKMAPYELIVCRELYQTLDQAGILGCTKKELQVIFTEPVLLQSCLQNLIEADAVVRVGVTVWRYVTLAKARPWLTHTLKNNRGRGQAYPKNVQADEVSFGDQLDSEAVAVKGDNINQHTSGSGSIAVPLVLAFPNIAQEPSDSCSSHGDVCDPSSPRETPDPCVKFFRGDLARDSRRSSDPETAGEDASERGMSTGNGGELIDSVTSVEGRTKVADSVTGIEDQDEMNELITSIEDQTEMNEPITSIEDQAEMNEPITSIEDQAEMNEPITSIEDQAEMNEPITSVDTENVGEVIAGAIKTGNRSRSKKDAQSFPKNHAESAKLQPTSTYERVCLQSKMWRKPEGGVNREVLHSYLDAILCFLLSHPGCSLLKLGQRFHPIFSPVALRELVEILEELGCLKVIVLKPRPPASLFSKRAPAVSPCVSDSSEDSTSDVLYEPTVDCVHRLGQFLDFLHK